MTTSLATLMLIRTQYQSLAIVLYHHFGSRNVNIRSGRNVVLDIASVSRSLQLTVIYNFHCKCNQSVLTSVRIVLITNK